MNSTTDTPEALVEAAYHLFAPYRPHCPLEVCTRYQCCMLEETIDQIYRLPLRDLPADALYDYLNAAQAGSDAALSDEIRYFIPRIMQLYLQGAALHHSREYLLEKCHLETPVWQEEERALLRRFAAVACAQALLPAQLTAFDHSQLFDTLVMFHLSGLDHSRNLLAQILSHTDNPKALLTLCFNIYFSFYRSQGYFYNASATTALNQLLNRWLYQADTRGQILSKLLVFTDNPAYLRLSAEQQYRLDCVFDLLSQPPQDL